jgi:NAD(P)-dependent dehydrogenase (short-subunit alcohol dehydrogenase family)
MRATARASVLEWAMSRIKSGTLPTGERMRGKVCLVTGGGSGIGRATALRMAAEGAKAVVVAGRREAEITREDEVERLVRTTIDRCGRLDVVFNNAGFQERRAPLEQQGTDIYDSVFDTNVRALFFCLRHQLPAMLANGGGSIVVNASVSGVRNPNHGFSLYSASKAAAISLTRSAAMENAPRGIRINAVAPGRVITDMMLSAGVGDVATVGAGLPLRRMGTPEEVAEAVVWLSSDASSYVVGHVLAADGGFLAA